MSHWYYTPDNKQRIGPLSSAQMRQLALSGIIRPEWMVMREGDGKWLPAAKVKGLFPVASSLVSQPTSEQADMPPFVNPRRREKKIALVLSIGFVVVVCSAIGIVGVMSGRNLNRDGLSGGNSANSRNASAKTANEPPSQANTNHSTKIIRTNKDGSELYAIGIFGAYSSNEAAADAEFLNKRVEFKLQAMGVDKEPGGYCVWQNRWFNSGAEFGKHIKCHFAAKHAAVLAKISVGTEVRIRGICAGKTAMIRTSSTWVGVSSTDPVVEFKDCEIANEQ